MGVGGAGGVVGVPPPTRSDSTPTPRVAGVARQAPKRQSGVQRSDEKGGGDCTPCEESERTGKLDQLHNIRYRVIKLRQ